MTGRRILTEAEIDRICELRESNPKASYKRIAWWVRCTEYQVRYWLRERGAIGPRDLDAATAPARPQRPYWRNGRLVRPMSEAEKLRLLAAAAGGARPNFSALGRELGRPKVTVRAFFFAAARRDAISEELGR